MYMILPFALRVYKRLLHKAASQLIPLPFEKLFKIKNWMFMSRGM